MASSEQYAAQPWEEAYKNCAHLPGPYGACECCKPRHDVPSFMAGVEDFAHYLYVGDKLYKDFRGDVFDAWAQYRKDHGDAENGLPRCQSI